MRELSFENGWFEWCQQSNQHNKAEENIRCVSNGSRVAEKTRPERVLVLWCFLLPRVARNMHPSFSWMVIDPFARPSPITGSLFVGARIPILRHLFEYEGD